MCPAAAAGTAERDRVADNNLLSPPPLLRGRRGKQGYSSLYRGLNTCLVVMFALVHLKNTRTDAYQPGPVDTAYYYAHTLRRALYCKRHALDNCLGHNHLQLHLFMLLGQRSDELCSNPRGRACSNMCKHRRRPPLPITFMCVYLVKVALTHWSYFNMPNNCIPFFFSQSRAL